MDMGLKGKVAVITGGSEGIGKGAALSLAAEGAEVVICARRADVLKRAAEEVRQATGAKVTAVTCDVTQPDQIAALFRTAIAEHGRIDILVNNAGTSSAGHFDAATDETWHADLDLKLHAAIRCSREAIPHMRAQGGGRIINVTTVGGKAPRGGSVPTTVSRAAGIALTKAMSKDYGRENILVNTVCIGVIKSGQGARAWEKAREDDPGLTLEEWYARRSEGTPLGRVGETREAADVITFLASERASYITGASINIDGGAGAVV